MIHSRLDSALVARGLVASRTKAKRLIDAGAVAIDGVVVTKASAVVDDTAQLAVLVEDLDVGRGAIKLRAALERWSVPIRDAVCADIGASTGGFTQVLLEHYAATVVPIDVGHGQLDPSLRAHEKVTNLEGVNATDLSPRWWAEQALPMPVSVVVADLSFISLTKVIPALVDTFGVHSHYVVLVKPQFEVGRSGLDRGVVKDAHKRAKALREVAESFRASGLVVRDVMASPITGESGNVEYLAYASATSSVYPAEWDEVTPV